MEENKMNMAGYPQSMAGAFPPETPIAMAYVPVQKFQAVYDADTALSVGTIFAELNKPFLDGRAHYAGMNAPENMPMPNLPNKPMATMPNMVMPNPSNMGMHTPNMAMPNPANIGIPTPPNKVMQSPMNTALYNMMMQPNQKAMDIERGNEK